MQVTILKYWQSSWKFRSICSLRGSIGFLIMHTWVLYTSTFVESSGTRDVVNIQLGACHYEIYIKLICIISKGFYWSIGFFDSDKIGIIFMRLGA